MTNPQTHRTARAASATSGERRRELRTQYEERRPEAGVYALRNGVTGRTLLASSTDLGAVRHRFEFARATNTASAMDLRLAPDMRELGVSAFVLEVLDVLDTQAEATSDQFRADLASLEQLWREKLAEFLALLRIIRCVPDYA